MGGNERNTAALRNRAWGAEAWGKKASSWSCARDQTVCGSVKEPETALGMTLHTSAILAAR